MPTLAEIVRLPARGIGVGYRVRVRSFIAVGVFAALGCAPSEAEIRREFGDFVSKHLACTQDTECTLISPGCPLGCIVPIQTAAASEAERLGRELIEDYESGGASCAYGCVAACGAVCQAERCTAVLEGEPGCVR